MDRLERLGKLRDGILIIGGALYVLGYAVWSVHALNEGLGLLPALELQYLLAGSLLALVLLAAFLLGLAVFTISRTLTQWRSSEHVGLRRVATVIPFLFGGALGVGVAYLWEVAGLFHVGFILLLASAIVATVTAVFATNADRVYGVWAAGMIAVGGVVLYVGVMYPHVPQEIGGVKPRCGYLYLATSDASPFVAERLFALPMKKGVAQSRKLSIFFSGGDVYVVRARGVADARTYDIRKDIVKSVSYC